MYKISIPWPREQKSCETGKYYFGLFCVRVRFLFIHKFLICVSSISTATLASDHSASPLRLFDLFGEGRIWLSSSLYTQIHPAHWTVTRSGWKQTWFIQYSSSSTRHFNSKCLWLPMGHLLVWSEMSRLGKGESAFRSDSIGIKEDVDKSLRNTPTLALRAAVKGKRVYRPFLSPGGQQ